MENQTNENESGFYGKIGGKIKFLAKFTCFLGILASIIVCIILFSMASKLDTQMEKSIMNTKAIMVLVGGSIASWIGTWILYGFGQLVDNSDKQVELLKEINKSKMNDDI